ncbi:MAG: phosphate ABC transporter permease PstA [Candidatus Krumholzibacteriota bacterium]|nr:phosphate ABC transporter permease PstA [Candidatus Krumholzibacteriota bacterium]
MELGTRKLLDRSFTSVGFFAIVLMSVSLVILLQPILARGIKSFVFRGTIEYREMMKEQFGRGNGKALARDLEEVRIARQRLYDLLDSFEEEMRRSAPAFRKQYRSDFGELEELIEELLGPRKDAREKALIRMRYGQTRWDRALIKQHHILYLVGYDYSDPSRMGKKVETPRAEFFAGTSLEPLFGILENDLGKMMKPQVVFYWRFLFDGSKDAHFFGGIWPEMLGTLYLALGAMIFAIPLGVITAIYLAEYAGRGRFVGLLRTCISSLAGVPSIVFGLFGLAFFINTMHVSSSKSVLAGSMTLALLVLPTIIRASEEAILAVPRGYKEASMSLGASKWYTIMTVILPAAMPGILTSTIISLGRAAGETAPIIFTAAVSIGKPLGLLETLSQPTPALPWNIYNLATEHEAVDEIRHVQYGMVFTLVVMVLLLNLTAVLLRARISKRLRG